jgi:hypothetical protein
MVVNNPPSQWQMRAFGDLGRHVWDHFEVVRPLVQYPPRQSRGTGTST